ncbi:MAG: CPBP family intramembrane metalloprotease [Mojavia pulchra JT2-VF2]|jgi:predicted Abi (CAAX) family protease|uniref:CPBP family intramembrane metalloprotease n=1 Tax=Mojavia pulchra JT2-VF2 TaxID=287848 RepID=A0A951PZQ3_9NOST|nr:CPBP family intramembrane metalloprotease [Mojavia pulchra JT2-VF2]
MRHQLNSLLNLKIIYRLKAAISIIPNTRSCLTSIILLLSFTIISVPIGLYFNFLKFGFVHLNLAEIIKLIAICLFTPAITEEIFFRVLLLPHVTENVSPIKKGLWGCISLAIFIIYHPLNALTAYPAGFPTFMNPFFLLLAGFLGIICTSAYLQSGSLWTPVAIHWVVVAGWLLLFGGYERLNT